MSLNPNITTAHIIAAIESSNNPFAYRFEPGVMGRSRRTDQADLLHTIERINMVDAESASVIYSSSYGLFQIMGFNLYSELEYNASFGFFLANVQDQLKAFNNFLIHEKIKFTPEELLNDTAKRQLFAQVYNGPGNSDVYADKILKTIQTMKA